MPGLKQAGRIANDRLTKHLAKHGYRPKPLTPALWSHDTRDITFTLVVDDFGVKYVGEENFDHLVQALEAMYTVTVDKKEEKYLGLTLEWNYDKGWVRISMPGYVLQAIKRFQHVARTRRQDAPHAYKKPTYGKPTQYAEDDESQPVSATTKTYIQQVVGMF